MLQRRQPTGLLEVDWGNSLTKALVSACPLGRDLRDVVANTPLVITGNIEPNALPRGMARRFNNSNSRAITGTLTSHSLTRTYVWRSNHTGTGGVSNLRLFEKTGTEVEGVQYIVGGTMRYERRYSGANAGWSWAEGPLQDERITALTYDANSASNDPVVYVNGAQVAVTRVVGPSGSILTNTSPYMIGNRPDLLREWEGSIADFLIWDRILTPAEMRSITIDPWQIYISAKKLRVVFSPATGIVGTLATTNANDTLSAVGTTTILGALATTNANDSLSASGSTGDVTGTLNTTNAADTLVGSGTTTILGSSSTTNNNDPLSAAGTTTILGSLSRTNANDTLSAEGVVGSVEGTLNYTNNNDSLLASGVVGLKRVKIAGGYPPKIKHPKEAIEEIVEESIERLKKAPEPVADLPPPLKPKEVAVLVPTKSFLENPPSLLPMKKRLENEESEIAEIYSLFESGLL